MGLEQFISKKKENSTGSILVRSNKDVCEFNNEILEDEFDNGVQVGESSGIYQLDDVYKILRGSQNVFMGFPNEGKTEFTLFLMVVKSLVDGWRWCFWSPEMISGKFYNGKVEVHYNDLANKIIKMLSGKEVYKHLSEKYNTERITKVEYMKLVEWVKHHFIALDPKNNHVDYIYDLLGNIHVKEGYDGILIDPFKNVKTDEMGRTDKMMDELFTKFKDFAVKSNTVMNWIAHPKANIERMRDGNPLPCHQSMLLGGASWDNSMDGCYSIFRPNSHQNIRDTKVHFYNSKQRKQELTTQRGVLETIDYDIKTSRYSFGGEDIIRSFITV